MKITKEKITQIINEEIELLLTEQARPPGTSRMDVLSSKIDAVEGNIREIYDTIDDIKSMLLTLTLDRSLDPNFSNRDKEETQA